MREAELTKARDKAERILDSAYTGGIYIGEMTAISLAMGGTTTINNLRYVSTAEGHLFALGKDKKTEGERKADRATKIY